MCRATLSPPFGDSDSFFLFKCHGAPVDSPSTGAKLAEGSVWGDVVDQPSLELHGLHDSQFVPRNKEKVGGQRTNRLVPISVCRY